VAPPEKADAHGYKNPWKMSRQYNHGYRHKSWNWEYKIVLNAQAMTIGISRDRTNSTEGANQHNMGKEAFLRTRDKPWPGPGQG